MSPKIEQTKIVYRGWNTLSEAQLRLDDGTRVMRIIEDHGESSTVLAYDPVRRCALLVRQLRTPVLAAAGEPSLLETIAGSTDGEEALVCARREAMEEAGVALRELVEIGRVWVAPGFSTERMTLFLAEYRQEDRTGPGGGAEGEHENIVVEELPLAELGRLARDGGIADLKTLALLQALMLTRPDLF